jgi:hypothetical protein
MKELRKLTFLAQLMTQHNCHRQTKFLKCFLAVAITRTVPTEASQLLLVEEIKKSCIFDDAFEMSHAAM